MLAAAERQRHLYILGQTGTGKSTLLLNLIAQDLAAGAGLALLDPHGDLAEAVLLHLPRARSNDLVYVNPADSARPIGFNPLSAVPDDLKPIVADGVVSAFRHVWPESWGPRLDYILTNAVRALLDVPGGTLADAAPPVDRRAVPGAACRAVCCRCVRPRVLAGRICRLQRPFPHRGDRPDPEQDRQGADRTAAAQHAGTAPEHDHVAPADGRGCGRDLQPCQGASRRGHLAFARARC